MSKTTLYTLIGCTTACMLVLVVSVAAAEGPQAPHTLRLNGLEAPVLAVDLEPGLRFAWRLSHSERDQQPTAHRIVVTGSSKGVIWDSGKIASRAVSTSYAGPRLNSGQDYFWQVQWWDTADRASPLSSTARFAPSPAAVDWSKASWIGGNYSMHRATFAISASFTDAKVYMSGLGWSQLYVNGMRVDGRVLGPGWTRFDKRDIFEAFDVTNALGDGSNTIGVMLGYGWRNQSAFKPNDPTPPDPSPRALRLLVMVDGAVVAATDATWRSTNGPVVAASVYDGETYDARLEQAGWSTPSFTNASAWDVATVVKGPGGVMYAQATASIQVAVTLKPVGSQQLADGSTVVDFGQNFAGFCRIIVTGAAGDTVTLRHAEVLMHEPYGPRNGDIYTANLRTARQTDTFTLSGKGGGEVYMPHFTYHGFRYVKISTTGSIKSTDVSVEALHFHTHLEQASSFSSSSMIINRIQENVIWGQRSNMMSVATDCDQRDERLAWQGDAGLSADSMALNFHTPAFQNNIAVNNHDELDSDGSLPDVAPFYRYGGRPADPSWSAAFPQLLWVLHKMYGDTGPAAEFWDDLMAYFGNLESQMNGAKGIGNMPGRYGDWVTPGRVNKVSVHYTAGFSYISNLFEGVELATALGKTENATYLQGMATKLAAGFQAAWYNPTAHTFADGRQTSYALALSLPGVVPTADYDKVVQGLVNAIVTRNKMHVSTGIIGAKAMFPALTAAGRTDVGVALVEQVTWPSWGFMAFNDLEPATTVWELWSAPWTGPGMNSRNHHMFSSISEWLLTTVGGLSNAVCLAQGGPAVMRPAVVRDISAANVTLTGSCGAVSTKWRRHGGIQCGKAPENMSTRNPFLPSHPELTLSCGTYGGVITKVDFASFGLPTGMCGGFGINATCHASNTTAGVSSLCMGKATCSIPSTASYWGDPCFGNIKRLFVQVQCSEPDAMTAAVVLPPATGGDLQLPMWGGSGVTVTEGGRPVWQDGHFVAGVPGVHNASLDKTADAVQLQLGSGSFDFLLQPTTGPIARCGEAVEGSVAHLACPSGSVVSRVAFASYGSPVGSCALFDAPVAQQAPQRGACDAGASTSVVESACIGQASCSVAADDVTFGLDRVPCDGEQEAAAAAKQKKRLLVTVMCSV